MTIGLWVLSQSQNKTNLMFTEICLDDEHDENCSGIKGVIDEQKTDGKMITVLAYIGV